ncbi:MAG: hypothetical protein AAGC53_16005 [Actinomycetota bacterium]
MSRRNRSRGRGKQQNSSSEASKTSETSKKQGGKGRKNEPKIDPAEFWGDDAALPQPIGSIDDVSDVKAVVRSLGRVPLTGQETAAEHWFSLVYERAAVLAGALAAAGGLGADSPDTDDR